MNRSMHRWVLFAVLSAALPAIAQVVAPLAPSERIQNLDKFKSELRDYHDCKLPTYCYTHDLDLQANRAIAFLHRRAAYIPAGEKLALILDIDETTLSNYEEMNAADFGYDNTRFNDWVNSAKAPAIPGTLRIFKEARQLGVIVIFLTGRPESQRTVTEQNLHAQGFDQWQELILRPPDQANATALAYKSAVRARVVAEGYKIVLNVGDQWSDLRGKPMAEYSVKYPDPYYFIK